MSANRCEDIADRLVDYADGELPAAESSTVADHLAQCTHCRARLKALRDSLELARVVWADNETGAAGPTLAGRAAGRRRAVAWLTWRRTAVAAAAALLIAGGLLWDSADRPAQMSPGIVQAPLPSAPPATAVTDGLTPSEIEQQVIRAGLAAQLLAAADILGGQVACRGIACERYRYIVAAYPRTDAAVESASRLALLCDERVEP